MKLFTSTVLSPLTIGEEIKQENFEISENLPVIVHDVLTRFEQETGKRIFNLNTDVLDKSFMNETFVYELEEIPVDDGDPVRLSVKSLIPWTEITKDVGGD